MSSPWSGAIIEPGIPASQRRAFPKATIQQFLAGDGGDTIMFADHVAIYYSPTALGFTAKKPTLSGGQVYMTTGFLSVSPCMFFALTLLRTIPLGDLNASKFLYLIVDFKQTVGDVPPVPQLQPLAGMQLFETSAVQFPAEAGPAVQRYTWLWTPFDRTGSSANNTTLAIGPYVRMSFWSPAVPDAGDHSTYSLSVIASTS